MARYFKEKGHILRFIEFMDVGNTNEWNRQSVVAKADIIRIINEDMPIEPIDPNYEGEVAKRYRYLDGSGEIGFISSVSDAFAPHATEQDYRRKASFSHVFSHQAGLI